MLSSKLKIIPEAWRESARLAGEAVFGLEKVVLAAHENLDGDALGSLGASAWMLAAMGKQFAVYSAAGVPKYLDFVALPGPVYTDLADIPFEPETALFLDCSERSRLGSALAERSYLLPSVNIDHHVADRGLGTIYNFIEEDAAATCQLVAYVALSLGFPLEGRLGACLSLGLMTDTGWFSHGNTSADVLFLCGLIVRKGFSLEKLRDELYNNWAAGKTRLWGKLLFEVSIRCDGRVAYGEVSKEDFRRYDCGKDDLEGLVEWYRRIRGVEVAAILREETETSCKFSLRSGNAVDVRAIAAELGGGGHIRASGGSIDLPLREAGNALLATIESSLKKQEGGQ